MKINVNRLLENSKRTSLIGKNIYSYEGYGKEREWLSPVSGFRTHPCETTNERRFGICIGHQIENATEAVYPEFFEDGNKLLFSCVRHRWTPAWQETYYRSEPDLSYYPNSGCISFCETKCITENDVFCSHIVLRSDKRKSTEIMIKLVSPMNGEFSFDIKIGALGAPIHTKGFGSVKNSVSDRNEFVVTIPPNGQVAFSYSFAFSKDSINKAETEAKMVLKKSNPFAEKEAFFNGFMEEFAPELITENQDIMKVYYYRWFLIYRAIHFPSAVIHNHPIQRYCLYESPYGDWYGCPVGLPVPHHTEETKWMIKPRFVYDNLKNWIENKTNYQAYIQYTPMAIWHLYKNHPDRALIEKAYPICCEYTLRYFNEEKEGLDFLPTINSSWQTGAEYQPAFYQHTEIKWDWTQDVQGRQSGIATEDLLLYRLDHIVYAIGNLIGCMKIAEELGKTEDYNYISGLKARAIKLLKTHFWSEKRRCFVSLDAKTGAQCDEAVCYDSFMPFLWNIVGEEYIDGFATLFEEDGLSCAFGMTSVEKKCPMYWFDIALQALPKALNSSRTHMLVLGTVRCGLMQ